MTTTLKKVVAASMVGSVAEWYEFFLYGTASALVFGELFFQQTGNAIDGILAAFALYAVGFLARPSVASCLGITAIKLDVRNYCKLA